MAGSVNKVILIGNLGRDPEVRSMQSGDEVCQLSVATSESWKDKSTGERRERTEWHRVVIFNEHLVGVAKQYLRKGSKVYLEGQLQTRKWEDRDGIEKFTTEVVLQRFGGSLVLLGDGKDGPETSGNARDNSRREQQQSGGHYFRGGDLDDEIPFAPEWRA